MFKKQSDMHSALSARVSGKNKDKSVRTVWLMLAPTLILFVFVSIYPTMWLLRYMFYDYNGFTSYFVGIDNFVRLFRDSLYWESVLHTFEYAGLKLVLVMPLSLAVAVMLSGKLRGKNFFRIVFFVPTVISTAVSGLIFYFIYSPYNGVLNSVLNAAGITAQKIDWLGTPSIAMFSVILVAVWGGFGNYMILFLAGLQSIPADIYESAKIDGATPVQNFFRITLPMLGPVLKVVLMLAITTALKDYQSIMVLTGGGPVGRTQVMFLYVYQLMFGNENGNANVQIGYASVVGIVSSIVIAAVTLVYLRASKKLDDIY